MRDGGEKLPIISLCHHMRCPCPNNFQSIGPRFIKLSLVGKEGHSGDLLFCAGRKKKKGVPPRLAAEAYIEQEGSIASYYGVHSQMQNRIHLQ